MFGMNLSCFAGNYANFMKNFTQNAYYGITSGGTLFNLLPEPQSMNGSSYNGGIYVDTKVVSDAMGSVQTVASKMYQPPIQNYPLYIEEHNCVLFATEEERRETITLYDNGGKLVKAYATGMLNIINASYKAVTCLNIDTDFYMVNSCGITRVPAAEDAYIEECLRKYRLSKDLLETTYVFVINTVVKNTRTGQREINASTDIKTVEKNNIINGQPLIFENDGLVIFDNKSSAEEFVSKYGNAGNYMISRALEATKEIHDDEIEDLNERATKDKRGMVEIFSLMGATSIASILTENVIKSYNETEDNKEATIKALKIFGIGAAGLLTILGGYKLYRHIADESKKSKNKK